MTESVMRWSESVTIYLAVGASFGVSRYLCAAGLPKSRLRAAAEGLAATLLWPLAAAAILTKRLRHTHWKEARQERVDAVHSRVEEASRALVISVNGMLGTVAAQPQAVKEKLEQTLYALRESAEQYAGLAVMEANADEGATPSAFEAELARLSGRRGDDLLIAARCVHRRNVSRIKTHYQRERSRLLRKLADLRAEEEGGARACVPGRAGAKLTEMAEARLEIYLRAADLFSVLEDERAAKGAAKFIEAESQSLRRLREAEEASALSGHGEERCTQQQPQLILKDQLRATPLTRG